MSDHQGPSVDTAKRSAAEYEHRSARTRLFSAILGLTAGIISGVVGIIVQFNISAEQITSAMDVVKFAAAILLAVLIISLLCLAAYGSYRQRTAASREAFLRAAATLQEHGNRVIQNVVANGGRNGGQGC